MSTEKGVHSRPEKDPYEVLGVRFDASEAEITRAYRKRALQLHPDKQHSKQQHVVLSARDQEKIAKDFHDLQQARTFLLDMEYARAREQYMKEMVSRHARKQADAARDKSLSESRKRMRDELKHREADARMSRDQRGELVETTQKLEKKKKNTEAEVVGKLRREGQALRDEYWIRQNAQDARDHPLRADSANRQSIEDRQVRIKWSRKKISFQPTEKVLLKHFTEFGVVDQVEILGSKRNSALVTFRDASSCTPCVNKYVDSNEIRAFYVGERKDRERSVAAAAESEISGVPSSASRTRDSESMGDWERRRAVERERIMRELAAEDDEGDTDMKELKPTVRNTRPYPPPFPSNTEDINSLDPLRHLELAEVNLLQGLVSEDMIRSLRILESQQ